MSFGNPVWDALQTKHRHFAVCQGEACRYAQEVAPFVAVRAVTAEALRDVAALLAEDEVVWLIAEECPDVEELVSPGTLACLQMILPEEIMPPAEEESDGIIRLSAANAAEMVALTDVAFPGFFRKRTHEMGEYYGVRGAGGELIAMGGQRLMLDGFAEISGLCAHPRHRGKGLATRLIWELVRLHRRSGLRSFLHVTCANENAIRLYLDLGFEKVRRVLLHQLRRA